VKGRTIGAVAVGFDPAVALPPQAVVDSLTQAAGGFESYVRQGAAPAKPVPSEALIPMTANYVPNDKTQPLAAAIGGTPAVGSAAPRAVAAPSAPVAAAPAEIPTLRSQVGERTAELPGPNSTRILQLLATVEAHESFVEAATAFATELALMFGC